MSVISLLNRQINNVLNNNTKNVINVMADTYNVSVNNLVDIWNNINPEFKIKLKKEPEKKFIFIDDDEPVKKKLEIEDDDGPVKKKLEIEDECEPIKKKLVIEN